MGFGAEVSGDAIRVFRWVSKDVTGSEEGLFAQGLDHLLRDPDRFAWSKICELYRRAQGRISVPIEDYAAQVVVLPAFAPIVHLVNLVTSPEVLYLLGNRLGLARTFSHLEVEHRRKPDRRISLTIRIPPPYEDSPQFFHVTWGILRAFPRLLGLPDAEVELELTPRTAHYLIRPPPSLPWWARFKHAVNAVLSGRTVLREWNQQGEVIRRRTHELTRVRHALEVTQDVNRRMSSLIDPRQFR